MKLVIVESPTKAKTIKKFLGKGFTVKSSFGHIRDLPKNEMGIDIENNFQPHYIIPTKAQDKLNVLQELSQKADEVILASDEDREGEAIAWHLLEALGLEKKNKKPHSRIVFHEITKSAIQKALESPRKIDLNLVDAQQARRVLDRLVGYELSPFLWKKIRRGLSAGRVQSVALRLIVEREREIQKFKTQKFWTILAELAPDKKSSQIFPADLIEKNGEKIEKVEKIKLFTGDYSSRKTIIDSAAKATAIKSDLEKAAYEIKDLSQKEISRNPLPPFTTSTLQQAAISNLGWSAKQTMMVAQKLYEMGHITYMRTDSVNLSLEFLMQAQKTIQKEFGKNYALESPRYYKTKSKSAQEAHEAIRPTHAEHLPGDLEKDLDDSQKRLYRLIWNRTLACQMQSARLNQTKIDIVAQNKKNEYLMRANGSQIVFDGFLKIYGKSASKETFLPEMKIGQKLELEKILETEKSTTPPPRYNEASLVKTMEEYGIGRPSTYAPTIATIFERKYIDKNEDRRLFPLEIGEVVNDLLVEHFPQIVDVDFTANMEEDFDLIAQGQKPWVPIIEDFYQPFHKNLEKKNKVVKKEDFVEKVGRKCPECGSDLIVKFGRFGKFIACSRYPECKHTEKTEDEKKMDAEFSGETCEKCGKPMIVKRGRFGPFLACSGYPECKNIKSIEKKTGVKCPQCQKGDVVEKKSKKGRTFYACNRYPDCEFSLWSKPTGEKCPKCDSLLVFGAKGSVRCSNKECDFQQ